MKRMRRKGGIFVSMIMLLVIYLFACAIVVVFFYFFKFHVTTTVLDEYRWNKIQEVPLDLLSMDMDGESFVSRVNKIHYAGNEEEKSQLKAKIDDTISKQLFYYFEAAEYPFRAFIKVDGIEVITKYVEACEIETRNCEERGIPAEDYCDCYCSADCTYKPNVKLNQGGKIEDYKCKIFYDISDCMIRMPTVYSAKFPFPLTFDGTDKFIDELSYKVEETK